MAKKVRRNPEEAAEATFEFPSFDEAAFVSKELELTTALGVATGLTLLLGVLAWLGTFYGLAWYIVFPLGLLGVALSPLAVRRLRPRSSIYTKGDWAGLVALAFFGWLALWFVLVNVA